ncbi:MAG: Transcriptional regulator, MerR family [Paenibacillus sp.]|nr:Transcriptional regulator, MerR family [Paenibacillus sp.]
MYRIGKLASDTGITIRTLRYYDRLDLLKPSYVAESGYRYYSNEDVLRLQHITTLKHLGFTLAEIKDVLGSAEQTENGTQAWKNAIQLQIEAVRNEVKQLQLLDRMLHTTLYTLEIRGDVNAAEVLSFIQHMRHNDAIDMEQVRNNLRRTKFKPEEIEILEGLPRLDSDDPRNFAWVTLLREVREQRLAPPDPETENRLAERMIATSEEWFRGQNDTLDKYWEWIRPESDQDAKVLGLDGEAMAYIERIIDTYLTQASK